VTDQQHQPGPAAAPQYSPDGRWWRVGVRWVPVQSPAVRKRNTALVVAFVAVAVLASVTVLGIVSAMFGHIGSTKPMGPKLDKQYCEYWPEDC
jgi:hypothetical protein